MPLSLKAKLSLAVLLIAALQAVVAGWSTPSIDFFTFWLTSRAAAGQAAPPPYTPEGKAALGSLARQLADAADAPADLRRAAELNLELYQGSLDATATPAFYAANLPWTFLPYPAARRAFVAAQVAAFAAAVVLIARATGIPFWAGLLVAAGALAAFSPFRSDLRVGNTGSFQLLALALAIFLTDPTRPSRRAWGGLLLGLAVAVKPTLAAVPLFIGVLLVKSRDLASVAAWVAAVTGGLFAGWAVGVWVFNDPSVWAAWLASLPSTLANSPVEHGNFALRALLAPWISPAAAAVVGLVFLWKAPSRISAPAVALAAGLAMTSTLLASGLAWLHYYLLLAPIPMALASPARWSQLSTPARLFLVAALVALAEPTLLGFEPPPRIHAAAVLAATVSLAALALAYLRERPLGSPCRR